jgi:hypothetical protein
MRIFLSLHASSDIVTALPEQSAYRHLSTLSAECFRAAVNCSQQQVERNVVFYLILLLPQSRSP